MRTRTRAWLAGILVATALAGLAAQDQPSTDAARSAWQFRRAVTMPAATGGSAGGNGFVAIAIPPKVAEKSQRGLLDLRLVGADGREAPYVLDVDVPRTTERRRSGRLLEAQQERRDRSTWAVDFAVVAPFDRLELEIEGSDFAKRAALEISDDGQRWTPVAGERWVFDRPWRGRQVHDTTIEQPAPLVARFVRVTLDDVRSRPVVVRGATAVLTGTLGGGRWSRDAALTKLDTPPGTPSRYRVEAPPSLPVERITITTRDTAYWRQVRVFEEVAGRGPQPIADAAAVYRLGLGDADLDVEHRDVDLARAASGSLIVEIDDGDSPPLAALRVTLSGLGRRLLVPATASGLTLYYGNTVTRRPLYDIEAMRARLFVAPDFAAATLGDEATNPRYAPVPPMAFLAARGAAIDTTRWPYARPVRIDGGDDIYTVPLTPLELGHLRLDLADLRLVDAERRQVPYVVEPRAEAVPFALTVSTAAPRGDRPKTSAFALTVPDVRAADSAPPLAILRLTFAEAFFTRPAVFTVDDPRAPQGRRVVGEATLKALRREAGAAVEPVLVNLADLRTARVYVEVDDGDNAPLTLSRAEAVAWVPRITFKATTGTYRLLLGNQDAEAPTYDLAALRQDVLAYSALPLPLDGKGVAPLGPNADYTRRAGDVVQMLSSGPALWAVLAASVAALLWLTRRILKQPPTPPAPPAA